MVKDEVGNVDLKSQTKTFRLYLVINEEPQKSLLNTGVFNGEIVGVTGVITHLNLFKNNTLKK